MSNVEFTSNKLGWIGLGRYAGALLEGLLATPVENGRSALDSQVCVFDIDPAKPAKVADRFPGRVRVCTSAAEIVRESTIVIVGAGGALTDLFEQLRPSIAAAGESRPQFVFMDGHAEIDELAKAATFAYGRIMFNQWVRDRKGLIGFWPGTMDPLRVNQLQQALASLGTVWLAKDTHLLQILRATSGCGNGVLAELLVAMSDAFRQLGLDEEQARVAIVSVLAGVQNYAATGGDLAQLAEQTCSGGNSLMRTLLDDERRDTAKQATTLWLSSVRPRLPDI